MHTQNHLLSLPYTDAAPAISSFFGYTKHVNVNIHVLLHGRSHRSFVPLFEKPVKMGARHGAVG